MERGGTLMQVAYCVHGVFAAISPYEIPREYKIKIKDAIQQIEGMFSGGAADVRVCLDGKLE